MYQVKWDNDYIEIELYDNVSTFIDLPTAKLYKNGKEISSTTSYIKGVNNTTIKVLNSNHVKVYKIDYRVYFLDYNLSYDHTITFEIVDNIAPEFLSLPDIVMPIKSKVLTEKELKEQITYSDNYYENEELTLKIQNLHLVNPNVVGDYKIIYELSDPSFNKTIVEKYYKVINDNSPVIKYASPFTHEYGTEFIYQNYFKISDPFDLNLEIDIDTENVNFNMIGTYPITVTVINNGGLTTIATADIIIIDTENPKLIVDSLATLNVHDYNEEDLLNFIILASDNYDHITKTDVEIIHNINFNKIGKYEVIYELSDSSKNNISKKMILEIKDLLKPIIELTVDEIIINVHSTNIDYYDYFNYFDNYDDNDSLVVKISSSGVKTNIVGNYYIEVEIIDTSKNRTNQRIKVGIRDLEAPVISLVNDIVLTDYSQKDSLYFKKFFIINDNYDSTIDINMSFEDEYNFNTIGNFDIVLIFEDKSLNQTKYQTTIYIIDDQKPTLVLKDQVIKIFLEHEKINFYKNIENYYDNYDEKEQLQIEILEDIDYKKIGLYEVMYIITDQSYNKNEVVLKVYIDLKYEKLLTGESIIVEQFSKHTIGMGITYGKNVVNVATFPSAIDTTTIGEKELLYIVYDQRGNYEEFLQTINVVAKEEEFKIKPYILIIIVDVLATSLFIYIYYTEKRKDNFDN